MVYENHEQFNEPITFLNNPVTFPSDDFALPAPASSLIEQFHTPDPTELPR
jgi:hypothetical protein